MHTSSFFKFGIRRAFKVKTDNSTHIETVNSDQYRNEVEHISEAILKGQSELEREFSQTIQNMQVMDACFQLIDTGDFVTVKNNIVCSIIQMALSLYTLKC